MHAEHRLHRGARRREVIYGIDGLRDDRDGSKLAYRVGG
jgi:hypothetical protein